ncbi:MAG TPA: hypothetical protein VFQ91_23020 [Bryobacteraceae bacterium]|nr:hypothetical protein [Bryobacteraceae bacterium]
MANDELITLLDNLQGSSSARGLNSSFLAQLPSFLTGASTTSSSAAQAQGQSQGAAIASSALRTIGGGLTLLPVVTGLLRLFGIGGKKEEPPPLEKFALPAPVRAEAGLSASGDTFLIDRGAGDSIRPLATPAPVGTGGSNANSAASTVNPAANSGANITVNVQAMDSQSFLDRREDIARAVREAMLQSHSLNDIVSEL